MSFNKGLGWRPDLPDFRDYTPKDEAVKEVLDKSQPLKAAAKKEPAAIDLSQWCSPIEDQGSLGSCTAHAGMGLIEYFQRRAFGKHLDGSRLFLYKVTRTLMGEVGDGGAYLRETMKAMVLFGTPPEKYYPYILARYDDDPPTFCYAFAQNYRALKYYRLDPAGVSPTQTLAKVKKHLVAGLPSMFGFAVYTSIEDSDSGAISFPEPNESQTGGHAVIAIGYNDAKKIGKYKGALKIRNSWGMDWGEKGYGWIPYHYIESGLAEDFWSLVDAGFVDTDLFK